MKQEHVLSDSLLSEANTEFGIGRNWIAYNTKTYYLDNADMWFFRSKDEAIDFANDNISDREAFAVIYANSIVSLMRQLPYGEDIHFNLTVKELNELFQSFDWRVANYDPLHDTIEATTLQEKADLARMETLLVEWENLYKREPDEALQLAITYWEGHPMERYKNDFITIKNDLMKENLEHLTTKLRNHGFGETLAAELEKQIQKGQPEITLPFKSEINKREIEATLYFGKSEKSELYFFNKYDCRLKNEKEETMAQTFYINNGWGVTLKEAYNLLNGRAVHKELTNKEEEKYKAWIQLDFSSKDKNGNYERKQYHENYGYDLTKALSPYPIKEMVKEDDMKSLVKSLERGNCQMVTVQSPGGEVKVFMEANPQFKGINVYDNKMARLGQEQRETLMHKPEMKEQKNEESKSLLPKKDKGNGLIEKKKTSRGKGIEIK